MTAVNSGVPRSAVTARAPTVVLPIAILTPETASPVTAGSCSRERKREGSGWPSTRLKLIWNDSP